MLENLLPAIGQTALDGIHAVTPSPVGDTAFQDVLSAYGEDFILLGGVFRPEVFQKPRVSAGEIHKALDEVYTPQIRKANLLLWLVADGLPTPLERFLSVRDWMEANSRI